MRTYTEAEKADIKKFLMDLADKSVEQAMEYFDQPFAIKPDITIYEALGPFKLLSTIINAYEIAAMEYMNSPEGQLKIQEMKLEADIKGGSKKEN